MLFRQHKLWNSLLQDGGKAKYINRLKGEEKNSQKIGLFVAMKYKEQTGSPSH